MHHFQEDSKPHLIPGFHFVLILAPNPQLIYIICTQSIKVHL